MKTEKAAPFAGEAMSDEAERLALRMLSRAADAAKENPLHPNAEPRTSRKMTAAAVILNALGRGDFETIRKVCDALEDRNQ